MVRTAYICVTVTTAVAVIASPESVPVLQAGEDLSANFHVKLESMGLDVP